MTSPDEAASAASRAVGRIFRSAREVQRLSQHQVASMTEGTTWPVSRSAISDIERGHCLPGVEVTVSLSRVLHVDPAEILERVDLAAATPIDLTGVSLDDLRLQARERFEAADFRSALALYDAMIERLALDPNDGEGSRSELLARIEVSRSVALRRCGALRAAQSAAQRAVELAAGHADSSARACIAWSSVLALEGRVVLAQIVARQAVAFADTAAPLVRAMALDELANVLFLASEFAAAHDTFLSVREIYVEHKDRHHQVHAEGNIAACLMRLGQLAPAEAGYRRAIDLARANADPSAESSWQIGLGRLVLEAGRLEEAMAAAESALRIARPLRLELAQFRAEWLTHLIERKTQPGDQGGSRVDRLTRLYRQLRGHEGVLEVREFEHQVFLPARERSEGE